MYFQKLGIKIVGRAPIFEKKDKKFGSIIKGSKLIKNSKFWILKMIFGPILVFLPLFWGILDFFLIEFQNAKILIPRFWKSVKNWIFYKFYHFRLFFFLSNTGLWGTTLHKDLGKKNFFHNFRCFWVQIWKKEKIHIFIRLSP